MRVLSWNLNRRVTRLSAQAEAIAGREPDVVAFQEVTDRTVGPWRQELAATLSGQGTAGRTSSDGLSSPRAATRTPVRRGPAGARSGSAASSDVTTCGSPIATPRRESTAGEIWTFAQDSRGRMRPERGQEWDSAERDVLRALPGMVDVSAP